VGYQVRWEGGRGPDGGQLIHEKMSDEGKEVKNRP